MNSERQIFHHFLKYFQLQYENQSGDLQKSFKKPDEI